MDELTQEELFKKQVNDVVEGLIKTPKDDLVLTATIDRKAIDHLKWGDDIDEKLLGDEMIGLKYLAIKIIRRYLDLKFTESG